MVLQNVKKLILFQILVCFLTCKFKPLLAHLFIFFCFLFPFCYLLKNISIRLIELGCYLKVTNKNLMESKAEMNSVFLYLENLFVLYVEDMVNIYAMR